MRVRVGEDGRWYDFEGDRLLVREARELQELTGMGLQDFSDGIRHGKVDALVFMLYLAKRRSGEAVRFREFDDMNIAELEIQDDDGQQPTVVDAQPESDASPLITNEAAALPPPTELRPAAPPPTAKPRKKGRAATG